MVQIQPKVQHKRGTPIYNIGATSKLTGLPIWTIRWIEQHEMVFPGRTDGNQRLFSDEDIELLNQIRDLMEEGVNLPGVRVIMKMQVQWVEDQKESRTKSKGRAQIRKNRR
jgi:MerR family glutamine synthetase transcriptional repressor